jgi:hypothetical protein
MVRIGHGSPLELSGERKDKIGMTLYLAQSAMNSHG